MSDVTHVTHVTHAYRTMIAGGVDPATVLSMVEGHKEAVLKINFIDPSEGTEAIIELDLYMSELDTLIEHDKMHSL